MSSTSATGACRADTADADRGSRAAAYHPCGENGEFHTLVVDGPGFARCLGVGVGEVVEQGGFVFADVVAAGTRSDGTRDLQAPLDEEETR